MLLYSEELGKNAHKGPSRPCDFMKLPVKKRARKSACQREKLYACSFSLQSLTTRSIKSIRWQSRIRKIELVWSQVCRRPVLLGSEAGKKKRKEKKRKENFSTHYVHWLFCDSHIIYHSKTLSAINISPSLVAALIKNKTININADKYKANNDIPNCFGVNKLSPSILPDWVRRNPENL